MRKFLTILCILASCNMLQGQESQILLTGVNVFDGNSKKLLKNTDVLIEGNTPNYMECLVEDQGKFVFLGSLKMEKSNLTLLNEKI